MNGQNWVSGKKKLRGSPFTAAFTAHMACGGSAASVPNANMFIEKMHVATRMRHHRLGYCRLSTGIKLNPIGTIAHVVAKFAAIGQATRRNHPNPAPSFARTINSPRLAIITVASGMRSEEHTSE